MYSRAYLATSMVVNDQGRILGDHFQLSLESLFGFPCDAAPASQLKLLIDSQEVQQTYPVFDITDVQGISPVRNV